jgi:hypothetical protein
MERLITPICLALVAIIYYLFEFRREQQVLRRMLRTLEARISCLEHPPEPAQIQPPQIIPTAEHTTPITQPASDPQPILYKDTYVEPPTRHENSEWLFDLQKALRDNLISDFFINGNTLARVGVALLFIGAALLIKLAADNGFLHAPIEVRLAGIGFGGLILIALGWRLRDNKPGYALSLQGGGIALIYMTLFASLRLFHLLPPAAAFAMMLILCLLSALLAVAQNTLALAIIATCGGFLAPIVTSTGDGNHVTLFSYYALLNLSILAMAWHRSWRALNLLGFAFTFVIGSTWGVLKYEPSLWPSTQPFLILFFLFYVAISILFALRQPLNLRGYINGTLVFGTPIITFALQAVLVEPYTDGLTYSAIILCAFYAVLAYLTFRFGQHSLRLLSESFLAIGSVFGTLAIPLALDNQGTVAAWALEGVALIYIGMRQQRRYAFYIGFLLQLAAAFFVLGEMIEAEHIQHWPLLNSAYLSGLLMAIAGLLSGYLLKQNPQQNTRPSNLAKLTFIWSIGWWLLTHFYEIAMHNYSMDNPLPWQPAADCWLLLFGSASVLLAHLLGKKLQWQQLQKLEQSSLLFMGLVFLGNLGNHQPIEDIVTASAWIISFSCLYFLLKQASEPLSKHQQWQHGGAMWMATLLISWQLCGWLHDLNFLANTWGFCCLLLIPSAALLLILSSTQRITWPFKLHAALYQQFVSAPIAAAMIALIAIGNSTQAGSSTPLIYLPLLNPLDISTAFALISLLVWQRHLEKPPFGLSSTAAKIGFGVLAFLWINSALLRTLHHWYGLDLQLDAITHSNLAQMCLTVLWSSIAMLVMFLSSQRGQRSGWIVGAILLAIVVVKLFLLDLDSAGSIMRIISFMFVGVLMLIIGYFRPIPPKRETS